MGRDNTGRPTDTPIGSGVNVTGQDFEKRSILLTQISATTVNAMMPAISNALICYEDTVVSHEDKVVYKL